MSTDAARQRARIHEELDTAEAIFRELVEQADPARLGTPTRGTRWTNEELLFHILFGYLVVRALLPLVRVFGRLPRPASRGFAAALDAGTRPFDTVNFYGSRFGARVINHRRMVRVFDQIIAGLHRRVDRESDGALARGMAFPTRWDPFFRPFMTLADVYLYPSQHLEFHRRQLTLDADRP